MITNQFLKIWLLSINIINFKEILLIFLILRLKPCPIGVYFNFARHTREPYRKMGSPIGPVWWLTNDQAISYAPCK